MLLHAIMKPYSVTSVLCCGDYTFRPSEKALICNTERTNSSCICNCDKVQNLCDCPGITCSRSSFSMFVQTPHVSLVPITSHHDCIPSKVTGVIVGSRHLLYHQEVHTPSLHCLLNTISITIFQCPFNAQFV